MIRRAALVILLAASMLAPATAAASSIEERVARAGELLRQWRYGEAEEMITRLAADASARPDVRYLRAELAFLRGEYEQSLALLEEIGEGRARAVDDLRSLVTSTHATTRGFARHTSTRGNFEIFYPPGAEELIVELAAETLERAYDALGETLGYRPEEPVRVEILAAPRDLAQVSTLSEEAIETTGTIALCKYNKLMVVTPRATVFGYPWMDTLVHEYVHYVVSRVSHDTVPVWLHEGLARFEQDRWRAEPGLRLSGVAEHLLATALRSGELIPFDDMHPSMALLPSQEAAALAFAEVYSMVSYLHEQVGYAGIRQMLALQRDGSEARAAVAEVVGAPWPAVEQRWKRHLRGLDLRPRSELAGRASSRRIRFSRGADGPDDNVGLDEVAHERARKHSRLGGILRAHGRPAAAAIQYEKALALVGPEDPFVAAKLSRTYLELERYEEAIRLAEPLAGADENDPTPATTLGVAYLAIGEVESARRAFEAALRISPFDPQVRCGLAAAYEAEGDDRAERERDACRALRS
jgi:Flp pilus assembly protein TadD